MKMPGEQFLEYDIAHCGYRKPSKEIQVLMLAGNVQVEMCVWAIWDIELLAEPQPDDEVVVDGKRWIIRSPIAHCFKTRYNCLCQKAVGQ